MSLQCMEVWGGNQAVDSAVSVPGLDVWVYSQPYQRHAGGGDIHYLSMCAAGKIARFALADVAGHGETADALAVTLRDIMRRHINTLDQSRLARAVNKALVDLEAHGRFATAVFATYFSPSDHLVVCNAGHPRPMWFSAARGEWSLLEPAVAPVSEEVANLPLGVIDPTPYVQYAVRLDAGDVVVLYTDAAIEASSPSGRQLGEEGLLECARRAEARDPMALARRLTGAVDEWSGHAEREDDLTFMVLHHNASEPPRQSIGERLRVTLKMLGLGGGA